MTCILKNLSVLLILASVVACVPNQESSNSRKSSKQTSNTSTGTTTGTEVPPTFTTVLNFFQNGINATSSTLTIDIDFADGLYLRGKEVDTFIKNGSTTVVQCGLIHYKNSEGVGIAKTLVLAMIPRSFYNFTTKQMEYYFHFSPADKPANQAQCLTTGVLSELAVKFVGTTAVYDVKSLCTNCLFSKLESEGLVMIGKGGQSLSTMQTHYLSLDLSTKGTSSIPVGTGCSSSEECKSKGFDCCSFGQCVTDKTLKPGVDETSASFLQAQAEILLNPNSIVNYPNFYFLCASNIPPPNPTPIPTDPNDEQAARFLKMKELFECTSTDTAEASICTITYPAANTNIVPFITGKDDRNFNSTYSGTQAITNHSIVEISHGGETLYQNGQVLQAGSFGINGTPGNINAGNDNLTDPVTIQLSHAADLSAANDDLKIRYRIDGSCEYVNQTLAKCRKYYMQGQNVGYVDDHFPASNNFILPFYADLTRSIKVTVDGDTKFLGSDYSVVSGTPRKISFLGSGLKVFDTQQVIIEYFVNLSSFNVMQGKLTALNEISIICSCYGPTCKLRELFDVTGSEVVDYACVYPEANTVKFPLQVSFSMSAKTVPLLYHDSDGNHHLTVTAEILPQEGNKFEYTKANLLTPNNVNQYVGFNEIYGSISFSPTAAKPPSMVQIEKGKTYDIFVDRGSYATCLNCGNDYWASLVKIFPANFTMNGGGYRPHSSQTNKEKVDINRADDLIFGRACWLPASMIPWSHSPKSEKTSQRRARLAAQHFLFANGYQRDWYGFDYGSVIASFDGNQWFAVGNQRRIKATSTKLFVAINSYFADQTSESSFTVTVSEASLAVASGSQVNTSEKSDGADCRKYHECETDRDCAGQLGWDYTCENVSQILTDWPLFDVNGRELPTGERENLKLTQLFNDNLTGRKCVYRGRGAPCSTNYTSSTATDNYAKVDTSLAGGGGNYGLLSCAPNYYCQKIAEGIDVPRFNNKIARFAASPRTQNLSSSVLEDTLPEFGFGARLIGRPFSYNGKEAIANSDARGNLNSNKVTALCVPGKDPTFTSTLDAFNKMNARKPTSVGQELFEGDQVQAQGMTMNSDLAHNFHVLSCPILTDAGTYLYKDSAYATVALDDAANENFVKYLAASQATTTAALSVFNSSDFQDIDLLKFFSTSYIEERTYQQNRCLRTTGAVCHTDQDCVANEYITNFIKQVDVTSDDWDGIGKMNAYEVKFWQNELICSQPAAPTEEDFALKNNRCCRASDKTFNIAQQVDSNGEDTTPTSLTPLVETSKLYPVDLSLTGSDRLIRNSQLSTIVQEIKAATNPHKTLTYPQNDICSSGAGCLPTTNMINQFDTFQLVGKRTCCSEHWIRNFHEENGGGHEWIVPAKFQPFPIENLRCFNWAECAGCNAPDFICDTATPQDSTCPIKNIVTSKANKILEHVIRFDLIGIPQVRIENPQNNSDLICSIDVEASGDGSMEPNDDPTELFTIPSTFKNQATPYGVTGEFTSQDYSAGDKDNFSDDLKMIWSKDEFSCCMPAGTDWLNRTEPHSFCCTGFVGATSGRCAIPDLGNVSLYFNKYVSSISHTSTADLGYDDETGYPTNIDGLMQAACTLKVCNSGRVGTGLAYHALKVPGHDGENYTTTRFHESPNEIDGTDTATSGLFEAGVRWNNQVYCIPADAFGGTVPQGMRILDCNGI